MNLHSALFALGALLTLAGTLPAQAGPPPEYCLKGGRDYTGAQRPASSYGSKLTCLASHPSYCTEGGPDYSGVVRPANYWGNRLACAGIAAPDYCFNGARDFTGVMRPASYFGDQLVCAGSNPSYCTQGGPDYSGAYRPANYYGYKLACAGVRPSYCTQGGPTFAGVNLPASAYGSYLACASSEPDYCRNGGPDYGGTFRAADYFANYRACQPGMTLGNILISANEATSSCNTTGVASLTYNLLEPAEMAAITTLPKFASAPTISGIVNQGIIGGKNWIQIWGTNLSPKQFSYDCPNSSSGTAELLQTPNPNQLNLGFSSIDGGCYFNVIGYKP